VFYLDENKGRNALVRENMSAEIEMLKDSQVD
jgi:hypothetical protein